MKVGLTLRNRAARRWLPVALVVSGILFATLTVLSSASFTAPDAIYQTAVMETENWMKYWSPNRRYYVSLAPDGVFAWIVDTTEMRAVTPSIYLRHPDFEAWSSDSRYAIFSSSNQYGAEWANIFDTYTWQNVGFSHPCHGFEMSDCSERFGGFVPDDSGLILGRDVIIRFEELEQSRRF